jgi:hypothetical protein
LWSSARRDLLYVKDLLKFLDPNEIIQQITRRIVYKAKKIEDPFEILENGRALAFLRGQILL